MPKPVGVRTGSSLEPRRDVPVDEEHPIRPQDPYATAKYFGELLMDGAIRRSDIRCISIRPWASL